MAAGAESWTTQQLTEFLALVSSLRDEAVATERAAERAAEVLEAEVGALVRDERVIAAIGFPAGAEPTDQLLALAGSRVTVADVAGLGRCAVGCAPLEGPAGGHLVVARAGDDAFTRDEIDLLRGMARVLAMALHTIGVLQEERRLRERGEAQARENAALLGTLRERQLLAERLSEIQRQIVRRDDARTVLEAIVAGARELIGDAVVGLRLIDGADPGAMVLVATAGVDPDLLASARRGRVGEGAGGRAIAEDRLVVIEDYADSGMGIPAFSVRLQAAMAAPVHEHGKVVGSLVVASHEPHRRYTRAEQDTLQAFAEHASLALTDARTVEDALHQAFHDSLTGLPNRALFDDRLRHALVRARRSGGHLAVLFLDLDRFKTVNDSLGHAAGDDLLVGVGERLRGCIRPDDTVARFGGDEFAVLLEEFGDGTGAEKAATRILYALEAPFAVAGREIFITASIGIATAHGPDDDPIRDADLAMYRAKSDGRGRYVCFEPSMHAVVLERLELEADLQRAVERDELILDYQPIVDLASGRVAGLEALLRWRHPTRGLVPPGDFIGLAEDTQLMPQLGRWVIQRACRDMARWQALGGRRALLAVGVNLSSRQLQAPGLADDVAAALTRTGLAPGSLILEITETVLMHDTEVTIGRLQELKDIGVRLAVDDFGTGYSSLQYLHRFPIDILKIAKSFVDDLRDESGDQGLARAIADLGRSFGLEVVAEGIEHPAQRAALLRIGCGFGQGFLFSRPVPAAEVDGLLGGPAGVAGWPAGARGGAAEPVAPSGRS